MDALTVYFVTFNCARNLIDVNDFAAHFFGPSFENAASLPDIIVLSLQEVAPIAYSFLGGRYLDPYLSRFVRSVNLAAASSTIYQSLIIRNVGMTAIQVFAKPEVAANVQFMEAAGVGVGVWGLGNKGAVGVRLGFSPIGSGNDSSLTFVGAHLAPMENGWQRRNEDWKNIVRGTAFLPVRVKSSKPSNAEAGGQSPEEEQLLSTATDMELSGFGSSDARNMFVPRSPIIFGGDLNYRTGDVGPYGDAHTDFPQPNGSDMGSSIEDFLEKDQLRRERGAQRTLHQLDEMPIHFPPTYKYSVPQHQPWPKDGSEPISWHWAKHRLPSWCDRILFSSYLQKDVPNLFKAYAYRALPLQPTSDHRPVCLLFQINPQSLGTTGETSATQSVPPFTLSTSWARDREAARRKELIVGFLSYLILTREGNGNNKNNILAVAMAEEQVPTQVGASAAGPGGGTARTKKKNAGRRAKKAHAKAASAAGKGPESNDSEGVSAGHTSSTPNNPAPPPATPPVSGTATALGPIPQASFTFSRPSSSFRQQSSSNKDSIFGDWAMEVAARREAAEKKEAEEERRKAQAEGVANKTMRILDLERQLGVAHDEQETTDAQLQDCEDALGKKSTECSRATTRVAQQDAQLSNKDADLASLNQQVATLTTSLQNERASAQEQRRQARALQDRLDTANAQASSLHDEHQQAKTARDREHDRARGAEEQLAAKMKELANLQRDHQGCSTKDGLRGEVKEQVDNLTDDVQRLASERDQYKGEVERWEAAARHLDDDIKSEPDHESDAPPPTLPPMIDEVVEARPLPSTKETGITKELDARPMPSTKDTGITRELDARPLPSTKDTGVTKELDARPLPSRPSTKDIGETKGLEARPLPSTKEIAVITEVDARSIYSTKDLGKTEGLEARPLPPTKDIVVIRELDPRPHPSTKIIGLTKGLEARPLPTTKDTGVTEGVDPRSTMTDSAVDARPVSTKPKWLKSLIATGVKVKNNMIDYIAGPNLTSPHVFASLALFALLGLVLILFLTTLFFKSGAASYLFSPGFSYSATATSEAFTLANDPTSLSNIALRSAGHGHKSGFPAMARVEHIPTAFKTHFGFEDSGIHSQLVAIAARYKYGDDMLREVKMLWDLRNAGGWFWMLWNKAREGGIGA
ncbi:MAG: hypothetical protein M1831_000199 [Alyxoria varia]|nr:MAG: hypothetical protein M1831_000199 [Alyxoria varia]